MAEPWLPFSTAMHHRSEGIRRLGTSCPAAPPVIAAGAAVVGGEKKFDWLIESDTLLTTNGTQVSAGFCAGCTETCACKAMIIVSDCLLCILGC